MATDISGSGLREDQSTRFQWKWVWITLGMFVVFYVIPLLAASSVHWKFGEKLIAGWSFGGVVVIAAVSAMLSKGVTIWEPAVAGGFLTILWYIIFQVITLTTGHPFRLDIDRLIVVLIAIFGLSLLGAGLGEGIQNVRGREKEGASPKS